MPVDFIRIRSVQGKAMTRSKRRPERFDFCVHARFAIQVEGLTGGMQTYEDRMVLVKAADVDDAVCRLRPQFVRYAEPYLNRSGEMVRWAFEKILDVYETPEREIDARGTEVYRKMRPEFVWSGATANSALERTGMALRAPRKRQGAGRSAPS